MHTYSKASFDPLDGIRLLPSAAIRGRMISAVETTTDVELVELCTAPGLGSVAQDTWLTYCDPRDYPQSRHWAHRIRTWAPAASGFCWLSKREPGQHCVVLFDDRCPAGMLRPASMSDIPTGTEADFDTNRGRAWLRSRLASYNVAIARRSASSLALLSH
jgi:hypothetical protein